MKPSFIDICAIILSSAMTVILSQRSQKQRWDRAEGKTKGPDTAAADVIARSIITCWRPLGNLRRLVRLPLRRPWTLPHLSRAAHDSGDGGPSPPLEVKA